MEKERLYNSDGTMTSLKFTLDSINTVFTIIFTIELLINLFAHWIHEFISNPWSLFDTVVVTMSLIVLGPLNFPISMLRALRVVRLFGRLKSSKKILSALRVSLVPMFNAFFIMLIVAMMCK
jgi:voltage-gated sodium channel